MLTVANFAAKFDRMTSNVPDGWWLDKGDASVGIFGEEWVHEDCTVLQGPGNDEVAGVDHHEKQLGKPNYSGVAQIGHRLVCKDCGAEAIFETDEYVGAAV